MDRLIDFFRRAYGRPRPASETTWHKWMVILPVRTIDGDRVTGDLWRRKTETGWEYRELAEGGENDWREDAW